MATPNTTYDGEAQATATPSLIVGVGGQDVTAEVGTAPPPFDNQYGDADVVLRTADGTDFYVHKTILRMSSTFFQTMFSLPQPNAPARDSTENGFALNSGAAPEVLPVPESSHVLESVLRWCYPKAVHNPASSTVLQISPSLVAAQQYEMEHVVRKLTKKLHTLRHHRPLEVFAEAYYRGLNDIARDAADAFCHPTFPPTLTYEKRKLMPTYSIDTYSPHMDDIPASWYFRLLEHHNTVAAISDPRRTVIPRFRLPSDSSVVTEHGLMGQQRSSPVLSPHPFHSDSRADVLVRSSDGAEFFVLASLLSYSSSVLEQMLTAATTAPDMAATYPSLARQLNLPENGQTIALLLQLCYPLDDPDLAYGSNEEKLADLNSLLDAARKYKVTRAVDFARRKFIAVAAEVSPVRLYFVASQQGWEDGLQEAAMRCVYESADDYVSAMMWGTAAAYRRLLVYRKTCRAIILAQYNPVPAPNQGRRNSLAKYFNEQSWLPDPSDSKFWLAIHRRVRENVSAARDPAFDVEALCPSFGHTESSQHGRSNNGSATPSPQDILEVARALATVEF